MKTLAEMLADPRAVQGSKYGTVFTVKCSRPSCTEPVRVPRYRMLAFVREGQTTTYCGRKCRGLHVLEQAIEVRDGVPGRVCTDCGEWVPLAQMTKGRICGACKRAQPRQKFAAVRAQAQARGDSWRLSYEEFMRFWQQPCHYCGDPIEGVRLDRLDPAGAYEVGNAVSCCWPCNRGKGDGTAAEFIARCRRVAGLSSGPG